MNKPLRLFIAIELSQQIQQSLTDLIQQLSTLSGQTVKWVEPNHLHLTLNFLGDTSPNQLPKLTASLTSVASTHTGFELSARGCGVFPNLNRPRVLWAGLSNPAELSQLQKDLEFQLMHLGFKGEGRPFSPHLTLGRVSDSANPETLKRVLLALQVQQKSDFGDVSVQKFTLFQSTLTPQGPIYTPLQRFSLLERA